MTWKKDRSVSPRLGREMPAIVIVGVQTVRGRRQFGNGCFTFHPASDNFTVTCRCDGEMVCRIRLHDTERVKLRDGQRHFKRFQIKLPHRNTRFVIGIFRFSFRCGNMKYDFWATLYNPMCDSNYASFAYGSDGHRPSRSHKVYIRSRLDREPVEPWGCDFIRDSLPLKPKTLDTS